MEGLVKISFNIPCQSAVSDLPKRGNIACMCIHVVVHCWSHSGKGEANVCVVLH